MKPKLLLSFILLGLITVGILAALRQTKDNVPATISSTVVVYNTWTGFKARFITADGRVLRPREQDTVSEGQSYAMLRAVWLDDKTTFDRCYRWSEQHLSRKRDQGDHLLAWRWQDGRVADWMPASDADIDYGLSLIMAQRRWPQGAPADLENYGEKAGKVLADILTHLTYRTPGGRLYLSPWILSDQERASFPLPVNPSYYSPAHFRVFFASTGDHRWQELIETTYTLLASLTTEFDGQPGVGLVPDWCAVDDADRFLPLAGRNPGFGWEAVRVPLRIALDVKWFNSDQGHQFFTRLLPFLEQEWSRDQTIACEYAYNGDAVKRYSNPLFDSAYAVTSAIAGSPLHEKLREKIHQRILRNGETWLFADPDDYFTNSLAWFADGIASGIIALPAERNDHDQER